VALLHILHCPALPLPLPLPPHLSLSQLCLSQLCPCPRPLPAPLLLPLFHCPGGCLPDLDDPSTLSSRSIRCICKPFSLALLLYRSGLHSPLASLRQGWLTKRLSRDRGRLLAHVLWRSRKRPWWALAVAFPDARLGLMAPDDVGRPRASWPLLQAPPSFRPPPLPSSSGAAAAPRGPPPPRSAPAPPPLAAPRQHPPRPPWPPRQHRPRSTPRRPAPW